MENLICIVPYVAVLAIGLLALIDLVKIKIRHTKGGET
jgi:hypothetical protein